MVDMLILNADGSTWDERNVADAVWNVPANQTQIAAWIAPGGHTFSTDPNDTDPEAVALTLTTMAQVQSWLYPLQETAGAEAPPTPSPSPAPAAAAPSSSGSTAAVVAVVGIVGVGAALALWLALRARDAAIANPVLEERTTCGGPEGRVEHVGGCRPGRPRCRYRRRARGICSCTAYHFPHRVDSGACRSGVPDVIRRSRSYRGEAGERR